MLSLPGVVLLLAFIYVRPQEFLAPLREVPAIQAALALALLGLFLDVRRRTSRCEVTPLLLGALGLLGWCLFGLLVRDRSALPSCALNLGVDLALYVCCAWGVQSFRGLRVLGATLLAAALFTSLVGIHQGQAPLGCHRLDARRDDLTLSFDGRPCVTARDCELDQPDPGADYLCEHVGLLDTSSIGGRVRYRGKLNDPNDLALAIGVALPFAFAFASPRVAPRARGGRPIARRFLLLGSIVIIGACVALSQSRGGQLVLLVVAGCYAIRRFRWRGLVVLGLCALPIALLGGRHSEEADSSSLERIECWYEGLNMVRAHPLLGVGQGQFVEHHYLTAHNAYVLAAAELGLPGLLVWSALLYLAIKIPAQALQHLGHLGHLGRQSAPAGPMAAEARVWAMAILTSMAALSVGVFFLSYCYHPVLWICLGTSGALSSAMRTHDPSWRVRFGWRDLALVALGDAVLLCAVFVYTRVAIAP